MPAPSPSTPMPPALPGQAGWDPGFLEVPFEAVALGVGLLVVAGLVVWTRRTLRPREETLASRHERERRQDDLPP